MRRLKNLYKTHRAVSNRVASSSYFYIDSDGRQGYMNLINDYSSHVLFFIDSNVLIDMNEYIYRAEKVSKPHTKLNIFFHNIIFSHSIIIPQFAALEVSIKRGGLLKAIREYKRLLDSVNDLVKRHFKTDFKSVYPQIVGDEVEEEIYVAPYKIDYYAEWRKFRLIYANVLKIRKIVTNNGISDSTFIGNLEEYLAWKRDSLDVHSAISQHFALAIFGGLSGFDKLVNNDRKRNLSANQNCGNTAYDLYLLTNFYLISQKLISCGQIDKCIFIMNDEKLFSIAKEMKLLAENYNFFDPDYLTITYESNIPYYKKRKRRVDEIIMRETTRRSPRKRMNFIDLLIIDIKIYFIIKNLEKEL